MVGVCVCTCGLICGQMKVEGWWIALEWSLIYMLMCVRARVCARIIILAWIVGKMSWHWLKVMSFTDTLLTGLERWWAIHSPPPPESLIYFVHLWVSNPWPFLLQQQQSLLWPLSYLSGSPFSLWPVITAAAAAAAFNCDINDGCILFRYVSIPRCAAQCHGYKWRSSIFILVQWPLQLISHNFKSTDRWSKSPEIVPPPL